MRKQELLAENRELRAKIALLELNLGTSQRVVNTMEVHMNNLRCEIKRLTGEESPPLQVFR